MTASQQVLLAAAIGILTLSAITAALVTALHVSGAWRRAREAERTAAPRVRSIINYRATIERTPAPEGLPPERLKARMELIEANERRIRAKASRKDTKRFVASVIRARAELLRQDLKLKRAKS